jgi:hypothetical protein
MKRTFLLLSVLLIVTGSAAQKAGYLNLTTFGILAGTSSDDKPAPFSAIMENHYRFNFGLAPGLLVGIEQLNENVMPVALNLKYFLPAGKCEFFTACLGGYSVSLHKPNMEGIKKATGGVMAGAEIGLLIPVNSGSSVVLALGYRYNELNYQLEDWWIGNYERKVTYNRFSVRIGIALY